MSLALTAGIFAHIAQAQDVFSSGSDPSYSDPNQSPDQGDVSSTSTSDGSDQQYVPPTVPDVFSSGDESDQQPALPSALDIFSSVLSDGSDQSGTPDGAPPPNPFFGAELKVLAEVVSLSEQKPQSGLPLPGDVRGQLLQAAAQLDESATNAQNYSLAGTNRFFRCMAEAVNADLQFLAQPGYVPAAQIANALHTGVWNYLTSNAYSNNLAMYDGAVQSMQHAMNDPACAFGQAAPALAAVAVTRLGSAMAEAKQVQRAANAAIGINEKAALLGYAKWYVPGLRCPGCLVYGTAEGGYADFANTVGGRTINAIPRPMNLTMNQFTTRVLNDALSSNTPVLFSLNGIEQIDQVLAGQAYKNAVTSYELRYLQQNWSQFKSIVRFYNNGAQVPAPWE
jgi:hypothetical protein